MATREHGESHARPTITIALRLFALSFVALFLELMMIRWVPSMARLTQYYGNLMLISSFLGLGLGSLVSGRGWRLFRWVPILLFGDVALLTLCHYVPMSGSDSEARFGLEGSLFLGYVALIAVFVGNTSLFVPLGEQIGAAFNSLPRLAAYSWDLAGSLAGTLVFGFFSLLFFSPSVGVLLAILIVAGLSERRLWAVGLPFVLLTVLMTSLTSREGVLWSPYHYITVADADYLTGDHPPRTNRASLTEPGTSLRSMKDPPMYAVRVNQHFFQLHGTIDSARYTPDSPRLGDVAFLREQYLLPYFLEPSPRRVAVLGAGGGMDCEAALLAGAGHVDAVEIDPALVRLSRRYNASGVYDDPRVTVRVTDARSFLQNGTARYNVIAFGYLDSQGLFSVMSNLRLDGFTYTVEGLRTAYRRLEPDGLLVVSFVRSHDWLVKKLIGMVEEATARKPLVYDGGSQVVICVSPRDLAGSPARAGRFVRADVPPGEVVPATDDWPYLYLSRRGVPFDYGLVIGVLLLLSFAAALLLREGGFGRIDFNILFLGFGFLLLETKSIGDCSLYFGGTWLVTMLVVAGCLLMVLASNTVAMRLDLQRHVRSALPLYVPLFGALALSYVVPREVVLEWPLWARLSWVLLAVPLPVFFAGLVFSLTFRTGGQAAGLFGANLIGAMLGGFTEYLGMAIGSRALSFVVFGGYVASMLCSAVPGGSTGRSS
jgi:hypothetical protein